MLVDERSYALKTSDFIIPKRLGRWLETPQDYLRYLAIEAVQEQQKLRVVLRGCRALRDCIKHAAELGEIPPEALESLKKMEALEINFHDSCVAAEMKTHALLDPNLERWW